MRVRKRRSVRAVGAVCLLLFACNGTAHAQLTQIETFTASGSADCVMPGVASGPGLRFSTAATLQSVDFAPGAVGFNGTPVDFDGTEPSFLASTYAAGVQTPVLTGPAIVTITGTGTVGGPIGGSHGGGCMVTGGNIPLGPGFNANSLSLATGPGPTLSGTILSWDAAVLPQLSGNRVIGDGPMNITSVDAVNGIVNFTMSGNIFAGNAAVPALTMLGFFCLATGVLGLAAVSLSRRTARGSDTGVQ